jgi:formylglycine-generating enzyme required for sulfatase activity
MKRTILSLIVIPALLLTQQNCGIAEKTAKVSGLSNVGGTNVQASVAGTNQVPQELKEGLQPGDVWTNSLGMEFVPVPGTEVLFSRWETRVKDFEAFAKESVHEVKKDMYSFKKGNWGQLGDTWKSPGFAQDGAHPVVGVSWEDAKAFCRWLTDRDRKAGWLRARQEYRLPRDWEWSVGAGLKEDKKDGPKDKEGSAKGFYPWGREWPPPYDAGNYAGSEAKEPGWKMPPIDGFRDNHPRTAPVGSFRANEFGVHDLGGNVWEWCEDKLAGGRVLRGGSWHDSSPEDLLSSCRNHYDPEIRYADCGFRAVVVATSATPASRNAATNMPPGVKNAGRMTLDGQEVPQPRQVWTNSLGMEFVPVPGTEVLFCRWETRVKDFEAFVKGAGYCATNGMYSLKKGKWEWKGGTWKKVGFAQDGKHPVAGANWADAQAFCGWLTEKEHKAELLKMKQVYRLPSDWEWSMAVGLEEDKNGSPSDRNGKIEDVYPWGQDWPPSNDAGNYAGKEARDADWIWTPIEGFRDKYPRTAPVGSFKANKFGMYDLGGNVWEWCEDFYSGTNGARVLRGASWDNSGAKTLSSACHLQYDPDVRITTVGFRVVVTGR